MTSISSDIARLVVRVGVGGVLAYDGYLKVRAWQQSRRSTPSSTPQAAPAVAPARTVGLVAGLSGVVGGTMLVLGVATPATGAAAAGNMALTATAMSDPQSAGAFPDGYQIPAVLGLCAGALALAGPGRISVDQLVGNRLSNRPAAVASLVATASSTALVLLRRYRPGAAGRTDSLV